MSFQNSNDRQYRHSRRQVGELGALLASLRAGTAGDDGFRDVHEAALVGQIDDVRAEIAEYELLRPGTATTFEATTLVGWPMR